MPRKYFDGKTVAAKIPQAMFEEIEEKCWELRVTKSTLVREAVREYLDNHKEDKNQ